MQLTKHAQVRSQQRAVSWDILNLICENHDAEVYLGRGTWALRLSDRYIDELIETDGSPKTLLERARDVAVVVSEEGATVLTVVKARRSRAFKAYIRTRKGRRPPRFLRRR